jgi:hypothetical protein
MIQIRVNPRPIGKISQINFLEEQLESPDLKTQASICLLEGSIKAKNWAQAVEMLLHIG